MARLLMDGIPWWAFMVHHFARADCIAVWVSAGAGGIRKKIWYF
jgi:hypothetical protein